MEDIKIKNPWIGLESYKEGEILYGRDEDIRNLTQSVLNDTDVLLYGKSGIGKSSILNAGVIPAARRRDYLPVIIRLSHKEKDTYLRQISRAIENAILPIPTNEEGAFVLSEEEYKERNSKLKNCIREVVQCKDEGNETLYEYFHRHTFYSANDERLKLLVIFDQFEEIFTLQSSEKIKKTFFSELADLLNDIMPIALQHSDDRQETSQMVVNVDDQSNENDIFNFIDINLEEDTPQYVIDNDIHFVFTIREDFLSEFEYYSSAIPSLKHNRYGLRPINEEQAAQIILRPMPGLISKDVARLIIETVTGRDDFLLDGIPEIEVDSAILSLYLNRLYDAKQGNQITADLVRQKGGEIISEFYLEAISDLKESTIEYLEENLLNSAGRRDNLTVYDALNIGGLTEKELDTLCNKKKILRQFNYARELRIEFVHDILCPVVKAHRDERVLAKEQQKKLREEKEKQQRKLREEKERRKEIERKRELERKKNRKRLTMTIGFSVAIIVAVLSYYVLKEMDYSESYGNFTVVNGWPVGLGEQLRDKETKEKLIVYYRLTREGLLPQKLGGKPFSKVEVIAANGKKTTNQFVETPVVRVMDAELDDEKARDFANLLKKTAYWTYFSNSDTTAVSKSTAYDLDGTELYSIQYSRDDTYKSGDKKKFLQWAVFYDANGKLMMITDNGIDRMRQTVDNGIVTSCLFFTEIGTPQKNAYGTYGYQYKDSTNHLIRSQFKVDKYGNKDGAETVFEEYKYGRVTKTSLYDIEYEKGMQIYRFDNFSDTLIFNENGMLTSGTFHPADMEYKKIAFKYDDNGQPLLNAKYKDDMVNPFESKIYSYDDEGLISRIKVWKNGTGYVEKYEYPDSNTKLISIWDYENDTVKAVTAEYNEYKPDTLIEYHTKNIFSNINGTQLKEVVEYYGESGQSVIKFEVVKDKETNNLRTVYLYDSEGSIIYSEWFDYDEYGNRIARAVAGIDGTPVRCPKWDRYGVCCYKMSVLYPFNDKQGGTMISATGFNEFGEESFIQNKYYGCLSINESPYNYSNTKYLKEDTATTSAIISIAKTEVQYKKQSFLALFVHVLSKKGAFYTAKSLSNTEDGLKDGDVLIKVDNKQVFPTNGIIMERTIIDNLQVSGGNLLIARPDPEHNTYRLLKYQVRAGKCDAELHWMNITEKENERLTSSIRQ